MKLKSDSKTGELAFFPFGNIEQRKFTATITYHVVFYLAFELSFIANSHGTSSVDEAILTKKKKIKKKKKQLSKNR